MAEERAALFVRIPASQARRLDVRARALGRTKQDLVSELLASSLAPDRVRTREADVHGDGETGGGGGTGAGEGGGGAGGEGPSRAPSSGPSEVLTLEELADWLQLDPEAVLVRVAAGELPGRRFGDEWRFARQAVLAWLEGTDPPERAPAGFGPPRRPRVVRTGRTSKAGR